jgi:CheY-like chemotaxis protein
MGDSRQSGSKPIRYRVLVADDDPDARRMMTAALITAGLTVTQAHDGRELYDILTSAERDGSAPSSQIRRCRISRASKFSLARARVRRS